MIQVYILECIDPATKRDFGNQCAYNFIKPRAAIENVGISVQNIRTKFEVSTSLNRAYHDMKAIGKPTPPIILQIDAHGNDRGFQLLDEDDVFTWAELYGYCVQLSRISNIQLILIMGTCQGVQALNMFQTTENAPFYCMFGPRTNIWDYDLMQFYGCFYGELLTTHQYDLAALKVLKEHGERIMYVSSPYMFARVYKTYIGHMKTQKHTYRMKRMREKIRRSNAPEHIKRLRTEWTRDWDKAASVFFEQFKKEFFLLEEFPQNVERFASITYASIRDNDTLPPLI